MLNPSRYSDSTSRDGCQSALQCIRRYCSQRLSSAISSKDMTILSSEFNRITGGDMKLSGLLTFKVLNPLLNILVDVSAAIPCMAMRHDRMAVAQYLRLFFFKVYQLMGVLPWAVRYSLALEKCRQPKKPRYADRGEGWGAVSTRWRDLSMKAPLRIASDPPKGTRSLRDSPREHVRRHP